VPEFRVTLGGSATVQADSREEAEAAMSHELEDLNLHVDRVIEEVPDDG
jgi:hypothetical protein